ncbi:hypothetical protein BCR32DRAFT_330292 [Anaeromyces robustus]|uniref:Nuclear pore complex protein Nup153 n=1 Tax=Anaeromyces robustus TaxID=1754192 RepID=A0A1Y1VY85_9FUNG|nr:hypothetical protein BCR32DRAFT_330292 [Anaeromyces robustus]|eukprot:ORX66239.1 hypothetical protein BCR32DRAFT_330292 [Anaeromyces robustus]
MEIRKLQNESLLKEKSFLLNTSKQPSTNVNDSLKPTLYDNILKNINKDETKDTEREKITSQKIQFKKLLRLALTSGRTTLFNDNVKSVESISIVRQDDDTEPEEDDDVNDEDYVENEVLSQDDDDNNEYDSNDDEYYEYLEDDEEYNEDEDGDIIDGENDDDDDDDDEPAKPSTLSLFSKKAPINPNFNLQLKDKKFNINPFGATTTQSKFKAAETKGFDYAASGFQKQIDPEGTWTCNVCMVKNKPDVNQCIACENEKPGSKKSEDISEKPAVTFGGPNKFGISFGANSSTSSPFDPSKFPSFTAATATKSEDKKPEAPKTSTTSTTSTTTTPAINGFDYAAAGLKKQADPEGTWTCNVCMVKNKPDVNQCIACENEKPGSKKLEDISKKPAVTFGGPNKFGISFGANSSTSSPFDPSKFPSFTAATATKSEDKKPEAPKTSTTSTTSTTTTPAINGFDYAAAGLKKQADPEGTWTCNACMVKNKPDATQCIACENEKPGSKKSEDISEKPAVTFGGPNKFGISFGANSSTSSPFDPSKFPSFTAATATKSEDKKPEAPKTSTTSTTSTTTTPATNGFDYAAAGLKKQADPEGTWTCNVCMVKNKPDATQCIACENEKPGSKKSEDISKKPVVTFGSTTFNVTFGNIPSTTTPTTTLEKKKPEEKEQEIEEKKDEKIDGKIEEKVEEKEEEKIEKEKEEEKKTSTSTPKQIIGFSFTPSLNNNNDKNNIDSNSLEKKSIPEPPKSVGFSLPSSFSNNNNNDKDDSDSDSLEKSESMDDKDDNEDVDDLDIDTATEKFLDESSFGLGSTAKNETHNVFGISTSKPNTSSSLTTTSATTSTTFGAFGGGNTTNVSFGQPSFGQTTFGKPLGFGQSTFGKPLGFGQSTFGQNATPVSTTTNQQGNSVLNSGFGNAFSNQPKSSSDTPVFGAKTSIGFGATSMMGGMGSAFGSTSTLNNNSPFGTASTSAFNTGGGFGAFANNNNQSSFSSFASAAANANNNNNGGSIFGNGGSFNTDNNTFGYGNSTKKFTEYR